MKSILKSPSLVALLCLCAICLQSCDWFKSKEATPQNACQLVSEKDGSAITTHEYNAQGKVTRTTETNGSSSSASTHTYNANGFLTNYTKTNGSRTSSIRFEYSNGLLSSWLDQSSGSNWVTTFEYSSGQKLSKVTFQEPDGDRSVYSFSNDKLIGHIARSAAGVETQPWVIENGLVKRQNSTGNNYSVNEYDAQNRRTRRESWQNGLMQSYTTTAFDANGKNIEELNPLFLSKGWPSVKVLGAIAEYRPGLPAKETFFSRNGSVMQKLNEQIYNNALNPRGFPLLVSITNTNFSSTGAVTGTANWQATYTYANCN